jgi:hypothetical protein
MKKKANKKRILIFILIIITVIFSLIYINNSSKKEETIIKVEDKMEKYNYHLRDNATAYYKNLYNELKKVLETEPVNKEEYAKLVTQMFLADFFNLDNKLTNADIGGVEFIIESFKSDFISLAKTSIYESVQSNLYNDRKQELPKVNEVKIISITKIKHKYLDKVDNEAYEVEAEIEYVKNLKYQTTAKVVLVNNGHKLEIVEMTK